MKTGALLRFACRAGAMLGQADADTFARLDRFGVVIGQAFQIADDLLDVEGDTATLGKAAGKDAAAGKATLVSMLGIDGARKRLDALVKEADAALAPFGAKSRYSARRRAFHRRAESVTSARKQRHHGQRSTVLPPRRLPPLHPHRPRAAAPVRSPRLVGAAS